MANAASLKETPGSRLNETVTDGNNPVWLIASGVVLSWLVAMANSGHFLPR